MKIIDSASLTPSSLLMMNETEKLWCYNGIDCCVTLEVRNVIKPQLDNASTHAYQFSKDLIGPILEMNMRGVAVDSRTREETVKSLEADLALLEKNLRKIIFGVFGIFINWRSNDALKDIFYRRMMIPPMRNRNAKGVYVETVDRDALEKLNVYFYARPIISHILALRDIGKKIGVLKTSIDPDGRMRTSYNIGGTTTFRLSSSLSDFGTGTNLQNIEQKLRRPFVADKGHKLAYIDLEQAESRAVGGYCWNIFHKGGYLDACESGDLHTSVCRMAWTNLPWSGDLKSDRSIAEGPFYRQHSFRHMAKVLGHGSNYRGKPPTMAVHTKLDAKIIQEFQSRYFNAFPEIPEWHIWTERQLIETGHLFTLTGHRRWFFGRRTDDTTLREAIAYGPQGTIGVLLNQGLLRLWRMNICQILLQIHDALVIQYREDLEDVIVPQAIKALQNPIELAHGRTLLIPSEAKVGWNWAEQITDATGTVIGNPDGLRKYRGSDERKRTC